jgi:hypothetical protein
MNIDKDNKIIYLDPYYLRLSLIEFHDKLRQHYKSSRIPANESPFTIDKNENLIFIKKDWIMIAKKGEY